MNARRAIAIATVVALSGCGSVAEYRAPLAQVDPDAAWSAIESTLTREVDARHPNPCSRGDERCIRAVVAEMQRRYEALAAVCDHRAAFALMYLRVTEGVEHPPPGRFDDVAYLRHLDAVFARLYFRAYDTWESARTADVPPAWRIAFDAARRGRTTGIGDMLLGMNAHITRDLPFALVDAGLSGSGGRSAKHDFDAVNDLLDDVQGPMLVEESRLFDPTISSVTLPVVGLRRGDIARLIAGWRSEAWQNARELLAAGSPSERAAIAARIEKDAAERARVIEAVTSHRLLGGSATARDAYCRSRRSR